MSPPTGARNVIGIDASGTPAQTKARVLDIAQKTSALIGGDPIVAADVMLNADYAYPVYGVPSPYVVHYRINIRGQQPPRQRQRLPRADRL